MKKRTKSAIIVFCKNAEKGKVKTRLAAVVGEQKALEMYLEMRSYTFSIIANAQAEKFIFFNHFLEEIPELLNLGHHVRLQRGYDLGEKMKNAFVEVFEECKQVLIIGSDCMELDVQLIEKALMELNSHDVVIGPSLDGGYYLLGMSKMFSPLFEEIQWSTDTVAAITIQRSIQAGLSVSLLPPLSDIDYLEDWEKSLGKIHISSSSN